MLKLRLYVILGTLVFAAGAGVFAFFAWSGYNPPAPNVNEAFPKAPTVAQAAAEDFLAGRTANFPVADGIDPSFRAESATAGPIPYTGLTDVFWRRSVADGRPIETHRFLVSTTTTTAEGKVVPRNFFLTVVIALDAPVYTLAAYPALTPAFISQGTPAAPLEYQTSPLKIDPGAVPDAVKTVVKQWADAYAADNQTALRTVTGDGSATDGDYRGLGGFTAGSFTIRAAVQTSNGLVLRVRLVLTAPGANGVQVSNDFDLLVQSERSTLPKVVAWGPAGSGPTLERYQNKV